ncbi:type III toxin-antitoxin system ToxN/AbiQ family toxin [Dubosiella newyorkensis]|uniref:type III toxin-antitoxin system ToxN/AbiQ family toxin n=1 Tax=Dubosiella newyorkensis TaxID=1862672 RepID=UPI00272AC0A6|nr:type III toxin-antitoxin system ToxN/AbiQ family toxin [Dubosiella newyorkensis]
MKKKNKLGFYDVNIDYIDYLKQFDPKVPNIIYDSHQKFLCGVVFKINGLKYYVPVSSFNREMQSNYVIQVGGIPVGSLRFSFMFPVPYHCFNLICVSPRSVFDNDESAPR